MYVHVYVQHPAAWNDGSRACRSTLWTLRCGLHCSNVSTRDSPVSFPINSQYEDYEGCALPMLTQQAGDARIWSNSKSASVSVRWCGITRSPTVSTNLYQCINYRSSCLQDSVYGPEEVRQPTAESTPL